MNRTKQKLDLIGLRKALAALPKDAFVVAVYINNLFSSQYEWMNTLVCALRARGIITVGLLTPHSVNISKLTLEDLGAADFVAVIPASSVKLLGRINVFIITDIDYATHFPPTAKVLGCIHGYLLASPESPYHGMLYSLGTMDGLMIPSRLSPETRSAIEKIWTGVVHPRWSPRSCGPFQLIPVGYPRHASMIPALKQARCPRGAIVYAPYAIDFGSQVVNTDNLIGGQAVTIINFLLENFPEHTIIFRPAPSDRKSSLVQKISSLFEANPRFILDVHNDKIFAFSRGAVLITDMSTIAHSFAFLTLRPAINFQPWQKWDRPLQRWDGGFKVCTYDALREAITLSLENAQEESRIIHENRERLVMPAEGALDAIADWIQDFYNESPRADWLSIERSEAEVESEKELVRKLTGCHPVAPAAAACFRNQESPFLAAYALHMGRSHPHMKVLMNVREIASRVLGVDIPADTYGDIPPDHIQKLYTLAQEEYRQQGDHDGMALVANLLERLNTTISKN